MHLQRIIEVGKQPTIVEIEIRLMRTVTLIGSRLANCSQVESKMVN